MYVRGPSSRSGADKLGKDQLWFYYTSGKAERSPDRFAICLAILRRDGFVSLDAGEKEGTVLTSPFTAPGSKLLVNVDAPQGELLADVLDEDENVLAVSVPMKGDLLREEVKWQKGNIADLKGKVVSLRFKLNNARLYSYWLK